jgi:hypothetical protein
VGKQSESNRWWENYLVRYLMPSIAGVAIVSWLCYQPGDELHTILRLPPHGTPLDSWSLILYFLYGNLFCYIASYPVLVFHATRAIDTPDRKWGRKLTSGGYIASAAFTVAALALLRLGPSVLRFYLAFALASLLTLVQFRRLYLALVRNVQLEGFPNRVSQAFAYARALARQRTITGENGLRTWNRDFIETYRHLREHGNSAFIFLLEIPLAALLECVIRKPCQELSREMASIAVLLVIWAAPAVFVHALGQQFERQFSRFDR